MLSFRTVLSIGRFAFGECFSLNSAIISEWVDNKKSSYVHFVLVTCCHVRGVTSIGYAAFISSALTSVLIPRWASQTCIHTYIPEIPYCSYLFIRHSCAVLSHDGGCYSQRIYVLCMIFRTVLSIGTFAFGACNSLNSAIISELVDNKTYIMLCPYYHYVWSIIPCQGGDIHRELCVLWN